MRHDGIRYPRTTERPSLLLPLMFAAALLALFWLGVGIAIGFAWGTP